MSEEALSTASPTFPVCWIWATWSGSTTTRIGGTGESGMRPAISAAARSSSAARRVSSGRFLSPEETSSVTLPLRISAAFASTGAGDGA